MFSVFPDHVVAGGQSVDTSEKSLRQHRILEGHILLQRLQVDLTVISGVLQDALDLGAVDEVSFDFCIIKRLDPEHIPRAEKFFFAGVPDHEGEHAPKPVQDPGAVLCIAVQQHLRVGICQEGVSLDLQILAKLTVIVDLTVKGDDPASVRCRHGLIAALKVDDRQTPESHRDPAVDILPRSVWSAVDDPVHHIGQNLPAPLCILRVTDNPYFCIFLRPAPQRSICVCIFFRVPSGNISGKSAYSTHKNVLSCSCATPVGDPLSADARASQVFPAFAAFAAD